MGIIKKPAQLRVGSRLGGEFKNIGVNKQTQLQKIEQKSDKYKLTGVNIIMTKEDFKGIREFLNYAQYRGQKWTQVQLAAELTRAEKSIKRYESGEQTVSEIVANKMEVLFHEACSEAITGTIDLLLMDIKTPEQYENFLKNVTSLKV